MRHGYGHIHKLFNLSTKCALDILQELAKLKERAESPPRRKSPVRRRSRSPIQRRRSRDRDRHDKDRHGKDRHDRDRHKRSRSRDRDRKRARSRSPRRSDRSRYAAGQYYVNILHLYAVVVMQSSPFTSNVRHSYFSVSTIH